MSIPFYKVFEKYFSCFLKDVSVYFPLAFFDVVCYTYLKGERSKGMDFIIRKTTVADIPMLIEIFSEARKTIAALGIDQWQNGYPNEAVISTDIALLQSYLVESDGQPIATFALLTAGEPTYDKIFDGEWQTNSSREDYIALHRVAISVACRGKGISTAIVDYAKECARSLGRASVRIDTHEGNVVMRKMLENHGFIHCGTIFLENCDKRVAYEYVLS